MCNNFFDWIKNLFNSQETCNCCDTKDSETIVTHDSTPETPEKKRGRPKGSTNKIDQPKKKAKKKSKAKTKRKVRLHDWTKRDATIAYYIEKFGNLKMLQELATSPDDIASKYICSTGDSLLMECHNITYLRDIMDKMGYDFLNENERPKFSKDDGIRGLSHWSAIQREVVLEYKDFSEEELRMVVAQLLSEANTTKNVALSLKDAQKRRLHRQNKRAAKTEYKLPSR